ncbi:uncharacterized protein NPIL_404891 [Nephila pilipes]|uniref:Uncharacterized protein n=1 Tax=Nephila pilipes TaxID=299642 RepID=A0A8X6PBH2_NEPPI|nr:uncharacterized protein NPIL_404891 [Nephila pilipes]
MLTEVSGLEPADSGKGKIQLLLGMEFFCEVIRGAPIKRVFLWSDSTIVLHWIKGSAHNWKHFMANRVTEIQENTDPLDWRHCDGKLNPADLITRGCDAEELLYSTHWFCGPPFLSLPEEMWPISKLPPSKTIEGQSERRSKIEISLHCATEKNENGREPVLKFENYSSWERLRRLTAWIQRFCRNARKTAGNGGGDSVGCFRWLGNHRGVLKKKA